MFFMKKNELNQILNEISKLKQDILYTINGNNKIYYYDECCNCNGIGCDKCNNLGVNLKDVTDIIKLPPPKNILKKKLEDLTLEYAELKSTDNKKAKDILEKINIIHKSLSFRHDITTSSCNVDNIVINTDKIS
jgi:hypothetical protein